MPAHPRTHPFATPLVIASLFAAVVPGAATHANLVFPADAGVLDVTDYGAIPDDGLDDAAAINALLAANPSGNKVFYFPNGTYDLAGTLAPAEDDGVTKRNIFQGQSRDGVMLKLQDNLGFSGAVIDYNLNATITPAQFFRNAVRDLTINTGTGNPAAVGLRFNASNQGVVRNVRILSPDPNATGDGLVLGGSEPGPLLIQDVEIDGFAVGLRTILPTASQTVEHLKLRNQTNVGWLNDITQTVFGRGLDSDNTVAAVRNNDQSRMLLVDSRLQNTTSPGTGTAIVNNKVMYVANTDTTGYANAVNNALGFGRGNARSGNAPYIKEWWANGAQAASDRRGGADELFDSPDVSLDLPVKEHPRLPYPDLADWDGPQNHLIDLGGGNFSGIPSDGIDDTASIQAAIDSGAKLVYLPNGTWTINGTVRVRNNVERVMGTEAIMNGSGTIQVRDGSPGVDTVIFERIENLRPVQHLTARDVAFEHLFLDGYTAFANLSGDVFINDIVGGHLQIEPGQNLWARQLNLEGEADANNPNLPDAKLVNNGGTAWVLGMKVEDVGTWVRTINGGKTELLGAIKVGSGGYTTGADNAVFVTEDAAFSAAVAEFAGTNPGPDGNEYWAKEVRNGQTMLANAAGFPDLYTAFEPAAIAWREVYLDNKSAGVTVNGQWNSDGSAFPGGWVDEDYLYTSPGPGKSVEFRPDLPQAGQYEVWVRWLRDNSGQVHSNHASNVPVEVLSDQGTSPLTIDMANNGGGYWYSLGRYPFSAGTNGAVTIFAQGANGTVIADAVRFTFIPEPATFALLAAAAWPLRPRRRRPVN